MQRIGLGIFIGIGLAGLTRAFRPIAKGALKLGLIGAEALKNAFSEGSERLSDLLAEVKQEIAKEELSRGSVGVDTSRRADKTGA